MSESQHQRRDDMPLVRRMLWSMLAAPMFRFSPHGFYRARNMLLVLCGAKVGQRVRVRRTVRVDRPWNLRLDDRAMIGDRSLIVARRAVTIGRGTTISQGAMLLTAAVGLDTGPITIGSGCWIAADTVVLPGSDVGCGTVVGARSQVRGMLPEDTVVVGLPAKAIGPRLRPGERTIDSTNRE